MDSHDWKTVYPAIVSVNKSIPRSGRNPRYSDTLIVAMYAWSVAHDRTPLNLVLGDGDDDRGRIYDAVDAQGGRLLTPLPANAGSGHRRQSPSRLEVAQAWKGIAGYVYRNRLTVERCFAHQSAFGGGLGPLPPWVRTLPRVRRWVGTKLIIYHGRKETIKVVS